MTKILMSCKLIYINVIRIQLEKKKSVDICILFPKVGLRAARTGMCQSQSHALSVKTAGSSRNSAVSRNALVAFSSKKVETFVCVSSVSNYFYEK